MAVWCRTTCAALLARLHAARAWLQRAPDHVKSVPGHMNSSPDRAQRVPDHVNAVLWYSLLFDATQGYRKAPGGRPFPAPASRMKQTNK